MELSIWQEYIGRDFVLLGVANQRLPDILSFIEDQGITYPVLQDNRGVYSAYNLPGGQSPYPRDFIVDQQGILRYADTEYDPGTMITIIESLLSEVGRTDDLEVDFPHLGSETLRVFPNPANSVLTVAVSNIRNQQTEVDVYDLNGRRIANLFSGVLPSGVHEFSWPAGKTSQGDVATGVYFVVLETEDARESKKVILIQ
jgi:hypothetical protein